MCLLLREVTLVWCQLHVPSEGKGVPSRAGSGLSCAWIGRAPQLLVRNHPFLAVNTIRMVHLRRALLLFAIVLGLAALVASLSRPVAERRDRTTQGTTPEPGPPGAAPGAGPAQPAGGATATRRFPAAAKQARGG